MFITGLGTATPPRRYTQVECWEALESSEQFHRLNLRARSILKRVLLGKNGIATRCLSLDRLTDAFALDPDTLQRRFEQHAPVLAADAATRALREAHARPADIDGVIVSTCTGYLCPGLTSYVAERAGLRPDVLALDLVGQGCGAALPNMRAGEGLLAGGRCGKVLSVCVEICSAAFYLNNDPGVLISACLFGDGAGAAVLEGAPSSDQRRVEWKDAASVLDPRSRDLLRFEHAGGMLRNVLTPQVPALAAERAEAVLEKVLHSHGLSREQISAWIWHAGGRDVLLALRDRLQLDKDDLCWSAGVLRDVGNISSPFVYHVLERALRHPAPGGHWWMSSFGAGFSCHGALLEVQ